MARHRGSEMATLEERVAYLEGRTEDQAGTVQAAGLRTEMAAQATALRTEMAAH